MFQSLLLELLCTVSVSLSKLQTLFIKDFGMKLTRKKNMKKKLNRPLALRGHVTNASFKQWVGILLMPKIDRAHKN